MKSSFSKTLTFIAVIVVAHSTHSKSAQQPQRFTEWHTTHDIEKFPCMNKKETELFKKIKDGSKVEDRKKTVRQTTTAATSQKRQIASSNSFFDKNLNKQYVCPPFHFVRKPYPGVESFGKSDMFERVKIIDGWFQVIDGISHGQSWPLTIKKGYAEGKTGKGTPTRLAPLNPEEGANGRFLIQSIIFANGSAPVLTLCYPEELHEQCNPYKDPSTIKPQGVAQK